MNPNMNKQEALRVVNLACDSLALDRRNRNILDEAIAYLAALKEPEPKKE
jgi:hypothetical protein